MNIGYDIYDYDKIYYWWEWFKIEDNKLCDIIWYEQWHKLLDLWCGTWFIIDLLWVDKKDYIWTDITPKIIESNRSKYPHYNFRYWKIDKILQEDPSIKIDLCIWLYGVMNYLSDKEIDVIIDRSDKFFLMDYKNGYHPLIYWPNEFPKRSFDLHKYQKYYRWIFNNYIVYSNYINPSLLHWWIDIKKFIKSNRWTFAKTYAKISPHEYIVMNKHKEWWYAVYYSFLEYINNYWFDNVFSWRSYRSVVIDWYVYWLSGSKIDHSVDNIYIINRAKYEDIQW